jgi:hypothetical protein
MHCPLSNFIASLIHRGPTQFPRPWGPTQPSHPYSALRHRRHQYHHSQMSQTLDTIAPARPASNHLRRSSHTSREDQCIRDVPGPDPVPLSSTRVPMRPRIDSAKDIRASIIGSRSPSAARIQHRRCPPPATLDTSARNRTSGQLCLNICRQSATKGGKCHGDGDHSCVQWG